MSMTSKPIILDFGYTGLFKRFQGNPESFGDILFSESQTFQKTKMLEKARAEKSPKEFLAILENLPYGINIFKKTSDRKLGF